MRNETIEAAILRTRLHARGRAAARAVLIDGHPQAAVARALGVTKVTVHGYVDAVHAVMRSDVPVPASWETVTVRVPKRLATEIRAMAKQARREAADRVLSEQGATGGDK